MEQRLWAWRDSDHEPYDAQTSQRVEHGKPPGDLRGGEIKQDGPNNRIQNERADGRAHGCSSYAGCGARSHNQPDQQHETRRKEGCAQDELSGRWSDGCISSKGQRDWELRHRNGRKEG